MLIPLLSTVYSSDFSGKIGTFYQSGFKKNLNVYGTSGDLHLSSQFFSNQNSKARFLFEGTFDIDAGPTNESINEFTNAFLEWKPETTIFRLGWQTIAWEGTDIMNLADVVNSKNYSRPLSPVNRASPAVRFIHELESWDFDLVFIPKKVNNLYPNSKSFWLPKNRRVVLESENTEVIVPANINYELAPTVVLNSADTNNLASRVNYRGPSFEMNIFYFEGSNISGTLILDGVPLEVQPATVIQLTSPLRMTPVEYRQRVIGGTMTKPFLQNWIFRLSGSNTKPIGADERIPKPQDSFVASLEHTAEIFKKSMIISFGSYEVRKSESNQLALLRSVFSKAYSLSGRLETTDDSSILWAYLFDSIGKSSLAHFEWNNRFGKGWSVSFSADQFSGAKETLLGSYDDFDFYRTGLSYFF